MNFFSLYGAKIDCRKKKVMFYLDGNTKFTFGKGQVWWSTTLKYEIIEQMMYGLFGACSIKDDDLVSSL